MVYILDGMDDKRNLMEELNNLYGEKNVKISNEDSIQELGSDAVIVSDFLRISRLQYLFKEKFNSILIPIYEGDVGFDKILIGFIRYYTMGDILKWETIKILSIK